MPKKIPLNQTIDYQHIRPINILQTGNFFPKKREYFSRFHIFTLGFRIFLQHKNLKTN